METNMNMKALAASELEELRAQMKLFSQQRLADASGVPQSVISKLQRGMQGSSWINVRAIQLALQQLADGNG